MKCKIILVFLALFNSFYTQSQQLQLQSPNKKIVMTLHAVDSQNQGEWYLKVQYQAAFAAQVITVDKNSTIDIKILRRGGFAISLTPVAK